MEDIKKGQVLGIHSYKHDGNIHRSWEEAVFLEKEDDIYIFGNNKTKVIESDGRTRATKEGAVLYFFKNHWFNIIGQLKKDGIYYYCNIASPFIIEDGIVKYIDYDLDVRVFPDGAFKILDRGEYNYHRSKMNYSKDIDRVIKHELDTLINMIRSKRGPFERAQVERFYAIYKDFTVKKQ